MTKISTRMAIAALAALLAVAISACGMNTAGENAGKSTPTSRPGATAVPDGLALVEGVDVLMLESFPVQIQVVASGSLPDSCTRMAEVEQTREEDTFRIKLTTRRLADTDCGQTPAPFEERIAVPAAGLRAGEYTVEVNGVSAVFRLDVDNSLPETLPAVP